MLGEREGIKLEKNTNLLQWYDLLNRHGTDLQGRTALYLHFPFCEKKCTFCFYRPIITEDHSTENLYLSALIKEFNLVLKHLGKAPRVNHIYFGGGTPTFFRPKKLLELTEYLKKKVVLEKHHELSIEINPHNCDFLGLQLFRYAGFTTVKLGAVDFDEALLKHIGRNHTNSELQFAYKAARQLGFDNIGFELVIGLPGQTRKHIIKNMYVVEEMEPDFIYLYEFRHSRNQQPGMNFTEMGEFYRICKNMLQNMNYAEAGPGFFVRYKGAYYNARQNGYLGKTISGYSTVSSQVMLGLGAGAISDGREIIVQNARPLRQYLDAIKNNELPLARGLVLPPRSQALRKHIDELYTGFKTTVCDAELSRLIGHALARKQPAGIFLKQGVLKCSQSSTHTLRQFFTQLDPQGFGRSEKLFYPVYG
jgi:oxygen-independent coproporphyrinogen III oxidase